MTTSVANHMGHNYSPRYCVDCGRDKYAYLKRIFGPGIRSMGYHRAKDVLERAFPDPPEGLLDIVEDYYDYFEYQV